MGHLVIIGQEKIGESENTVSNALTQTKSCS